MTSLRTTNPEDTTINPADGNQQEDSRKWQKRVAPLSEAELNAKVAARIALLEDRLRWHGLQLACGAEQEFTVTERDGQPMQDPLDVNVIKARLEESGLKLIERVYPERVHHDAPKLTKYEAVLGTVTRDFFSPHPASGMASEIDKLRKELPAILENDSIVSFTPAQPEHKLSAGMHLNYSLFDANGTNLLGDNQLGNNMLSTLRGNNPIAIWREKYTPLAKQFAHTLVEAQKEGLALYASDKASYDRIGLHDSTPRFFGCLREKGESSVALRVTDWMNTDVADDDASMPPKVYRGHTYRVEDRLAGANTNPYLATLAGVGALYHTVEQLAAEQGGSFSTDKVTAAPGIKKVKIPKDSKRALETFGSSALWQEIAGPELHRDIVNYLCAQQQNLAAGNRRAM